MSWANGRGAWAISGVQAAVEVDIDSDDAPLVYVDPGVVVAVGQADDVTGNAAPVLDYRRKRNVLLARPVLGGKTAVNADDITRMECVVRIGNRLADAHLRPPQALLLPGLPSRHCDIGGDAVPKRN